MKGVSKRGPASRFELFTHNFHLLLSTIITLFLSTHTTPTWSTPFLPSTNFFFTYTLSTVISLKKVFLKQHQAYHSSQRTSHQNISPEHLTLLQSTTMLFCHAFLNVLTAISAILMAHEAVRTTGVDVFGYFLQALEIAPSSPEFFYDIVSHPSLGIIRVKDSHHDPETRVEQSEPSMEEPEVLVEIPVNTSAPTVNTSAPTVNTSAPTVNTSAPMVNTSAPTEQTEPEPSHQEPEESAEAQQYHLVYGNTPIRDMCCSNQTNILIVYHRLVAGFKHHANALPSFWLPVLYRYAFALRRGFEALGAQIYDPLIFAEFKSTFKAGIISLRKSTKAFNWLLAALYAALVFFFTFVKVTQSIYVLAAAMFVLYPQVVMTTSEHKQVVARLMVQLEAQATELEVQAAELAKLAKQKRLQETDTKVIEADKIAGFISFYRRVTAETRQSATEAKAECDVLRLRLIQKRHLEDALSTADSDESTEREQAWEGTSEDEEGDEGHDYEKELTDLLERSSQDAEEAEVSIDTPLPPLPGFELPEESIHQALVSTPEEVPQEAEQGATDTTEASAQAPDGASQALETTEEDLTKALIHMPGEFPKDTEAGEEQPTGQSLQTPDATVQESHALELALEKASHEVPVAPLSPAPASPTPASPTPTSTAQAPPAASLEDQKPKLSAAASTFVPSGASTFSFRPSSSPTSRIPSPAAVRTPPASIPQPAHPNLASHFGRTSHMPPPTIFGAQRPLPAPFHVNGFRQGPPTFGAPARQPNAAGQMFVPRADRPSNRQRSQLPIPHRFSGSEGMFWVPNGNGPRVSTPTREPEDPDYVAQF